MLAAKNAGNGLAALIPSNMRAMAVRVDDVVGVAGFIHPDDRVDVMVTMQPNRPGVPTTTKIFMQNVKVLAVGQEVEANDQARMHATPGHGGHAARLAAGLRAPGARVGAGSALAHAAQLDRFAARQHRGRDRRGAGRRAVRRRRRSRPRPPASAHPAVAARGAGVAASRWRLPPPRRRCRPSSRRRTSSKSCAVIDSSSATSPKEKGQRRRADV